jgi:hypothetical protein
VTNHKTHESFHTLLEVQKWYRRECGATFGPLISCILFLDFNMARFCLEPPNCCEGNLFIYLTDLKLIC